MQRFSDIDTWVFDLDNTLYPASSKLFEQVSARITQSVQNALDLEHDAARKLQREYFLTYGTTLRGMMIHHDIDPDDYLSFVHDIDYSILQPLPGLRAALEALPGRRVIFTAGSHPHADAVLEQMGLEDLFDERFDIVDAEYFPKPQEKPYELFFEKMRIDGAKSVFFEDSPRNLAPAKARGMATVLVRTDIDWAQPDPNNDYIDFETADLADFLNEANASK